MSKMSNIIAAQKHEWPTRLATRKVQYKTQIETNKIHFYYIILFYFIKSFVTYAVKDSFFVDVKTFFYSYNGTIVGSRQYHCPPYDR